MPKKSGAGYQIKCVKDVIIAKEAKGEDADFERKLLEAWSKYPGYESAKHALAKIDKGGQRNVY